MAEKGQLQHQDGGATSMQWWRLERSPLPREVVLSRRQNPKVRLIYEYIFVPSSSDYKGVAISYTWGAGSYTTFILPTAWSQVRTSRTQELVSYIRKAIGIPTKQELPPALKIQLGSAAWNINIFLEILWKATKGHPFWLDQISLPQDKALSMQLGRTIPDVYRNHPVRILSNCGKCEFFNIWKSSRLNSREVDRQLLSFEKHLNFPNIRCGCFSLAFWLNRLWTRQEGHFAQDLQLIRHDRECYGLAHTWILMPNMEAMFRDKFNKPLDRDSEDLDNEEKMAILRFLRGERVILKSRTTFESTLFRLGRIIRDVSKPKDLVLAVWSDLPGYKVPENANTLDTLELLRDACRQYITIQQRQLPVAYINRFAQAAHPPFEEFDRENPHPWEASLEAYWIPPHPESRDTFSWYGQCILPKGGLRLDAQKRITGSVSEGPVEVLCMEQYLTEMLRGPDGWVHTEALKSSTRPGWVAEFVTKMQRGLPVDHEESRSIAVNRLYARNMTRNTTGGGSRRNPEPTTEFSMTVEFCLRNWGLLGVRSDQSSLSPFVVLLALSFLGIPAHLYHRHHSHVRFWRNPKYQEKVSWIPVLCIDDTKELRAMFPAGADIAYLVKKDEAWTGGSDGAGWIVVGMMPQLERYDYDGKTFEALCR